MVEEVEMGHFVLKGSQSPISGPRSRSSKNGFGGEYEGGGLTQGTGTKTQSEKLTAQADDAQSKPQYSPE